MATSNLNLAENVGFGPGATHTQTMPNYLQPTNKIEFPLRHPQVKLDHIANSWTQKKVYGARVTSGIVLLIRYLKMLKNRNK